MRKRSSEIWEAGSEWNEWGEGNNWAGEEANNWQNGGGPQQAGGI